MSEILVFLQFFSRITIDLHTHNPFIYKAELICWIVLPINIMLFIVDPFCKMFNVFLLSLLRKETKRAMSLHNIEYWLFVRILDLQLLFG